MDVAMDTPVGKLRDATHLTETDLKFYMQRFAGESQRLVPSRETASLSKRLGSPAQARSNSDCQNHRAAAFT